MLRHLRSTLLPLVLFVFGLPTVSRPSGAVPGLRVVAPADTSGLAGGILRLPVIVQNRGPEAISLEYRARDTVGWVQAPLPLDGRVEVPPGASVVRTIPLQVPSEAIGGAADFVFWEVFSPGAPADTLRGVVGVTSRADTDAPIPVLIAEPFSRWVTLRFAGRAVEGLTGAHFYRSAPGEPEARITEAPIAFEGGEPFGQFTDTLAAPGHLYAYRLSVVTANGFEASMTGVAVQTSQGTALAMGEPRSDAESGGWSWVLTVPRSDRVEMSVVDMSGRRLRTVRSAKNRALQAGDHRITWDGRDDGGKPVSGLLRIVATQGKARVVRDFVVIGESGVTTPH